MNPIENTNFRKSYHEDFIPVITRKETAKVNIKEVFFIETELRIVNIHTSSRVYRFYGKLDDVVKYLNGSFHRCHKSLIINLEKIARMEDGIFYFSGGMTLRVGQNSYRHTRINYIKYLEQNSRTNS